MLKDPTGLGTFDWFWDLFKEKTPEEITTKGLAAGFATQCIAQNCGKSRTEVDMYADCASYLNDWLTKVGAKAAAGAINVVTHDGGESVISECQELCESGLSTSSCCNGQKK